MKGTRGLNIKKEKNIITLNDGSPPSKNFNIFWGHSKREGAMHFQRYNVFHVKGGGVYVNH